MATLIAVLCPLVIDSIMGAIFRRAVLHRENCDSGGSGFSCNSNRPLGGVRSDLHGRTTFIHILHMEKYSTMLVQRRDVVTPRGGMCHISVLSKMQLPFPFPIAKFVQKS